MEKKCLYFHEPPVQRNVISDVLTLYRPEIMLLFSFMVGRRGHEQGSEHGSVPVTWDLTALNADSPPAGPALPPSFAHTGTWLSPQGNGFAGLRGVAHAILVHRPHSEDI